MEFNELQQIWDAQNNQQLYAINETALHQRILAKKKQAYHITNVSEWLMIIVNMAAGFFVLQSQLSKHTNNVYMYLLAAWMLGVAWYLLFHRVQRLRKNKQFNRSMHDDLANAISIATYQLRLSQLGRWSLLPIGLLTMLGLWQNGQSAWMLAGVLAFIALAHFGARWEHGIYKNRRKELEMLKSKLEKEE